MKDESFHLTPLDIRRYDFGSALRGYDKARVDEFRDQVAAELERLAKQCLDLEAKAKGFHEQLRAFRERDKALNDALVSAQQLRADMRTQAEREAELIVREARAEASKIVDEARTSVRRVDAELELLVRQRRAFLAQLRGMVERHLAEIEAAEAVPTPRSEPVVPSPAESAEPVAPRDPRETPAWLHDLVKE